MESVQWSLIGLVLAPVDDSDWDYPLNWENSVSSEKITDSASNWTRRRSNFNTEERIEKLDSYTKSWSWRNPSLRFGWGETRVHHTCIVGSEASIWCLVDVPWRFRGWRIWIIKPRTSRSQRSSSQAFKARPRGTKGKGRLTKESK